MVLTTTATPMHPQWRHAEVAPTRGYLPWTPQPPQIPASLPLGNDAAKTLFESTKSSVR